MKAGNKGPREQGKKEEQESVGYAVSVKQAMTKQSKIRLAWWIGFPLSMVALRFIARGRVWDYMVDHLWLTGVLPLVALFLLLFARGMYLQYRREPEGNPKMDGAHRAKQ